MSRKKREALNQQPEITVAPTTQRPKLPSLYTVYLLNDDYTPMDFVVEVLKKYFVMNEEAATVIMLQVHHHGKGICGLFSRDIAETKVMQVNEYAKRNAHPLMCGMEECL